MFHAGGEEVASIGPLEISNIQWPQISLEGDETVGMDIFVYLSQKSGYLVCQNLSQLT